MLNERPIFVNGFQRGGTNILMRLISSHPEVRILGAEIHELFYGRERERVKKWMRRLAAAPVLLATRRHTFWPYRYHRREPLPRPVACYVDLLFYAYKQVADNPEFSPADVSSSWRQRGNARMVCKCVNGVSLATPIFADMYPDATFVGLLRNGLALCEGFMRRGWSPGRFGRLYRQLAGQMLTDAGQRPNYHLIRFENLVTNPAATVRRVYALADLELPAVPKFKLQAKKSMQRDGTRTLTFGQREKGLIWCELEELRQHLRPDVNDNQIARLSAADRDAFLEEAGPIMERLGYLSAEQPLPRLGFVRP